MGTGIFLELTEEQKESVETQAKKPPEGAAPPEPQKSDMMVIGFEDVWGQPYSEDVVQYPNADVKVTSSAGVAVRVQMPSKVQGGKDFRITDVEIGGTPGPRQVCWATSPDFDSAITPIKQGGSSAWQALPVEADMAGKTYYFLSRVTEDAPDSYDAMFQGLNR